MSILIFKVPLSGEIMCLLERLNNDGMTIIMVTHSPECAKYAHRILQISDGMLVGEGSSQEIRECPEDSA